MDSLVSNSDVALEFCAVEFCAVAFSAVEFEDTRDGGPVVGRARGCDGGTELVDRTDGAMLTPGLGGCLPS